MNQPNLYLRVSQAFQALGWAAGRHAPTVAERYFETAVGPRRAYVMLSPSGRLLADYTSEGRNVLEANWNQPLLEDCSPQALSNIVARFEASIMRDIDQTYARGLWLRCTAQEATAASPSLG